MEEKKMVKVEIASYFQDIHTGVIYKPGTIQEFTAKRLAEIHKNLPGFVKELDGLTREPADEPAQDPEKPKKTAARKAKVAEDEPAVD